MDKSEQAVVNWSAVRGAIAEPRFRPYLADADGNEVQALTAYQHNLRVSGAAYEDLAIVEVALRNAIDRALRSWNASQTDVLSGWLCRRVGHLEPLTKASAVRRQGPPQTMSVPLSTQRPRAQSA